MNINMTQEVKDYLRMRGSKTITIFTKLVSGCWSPTLDIFVKLREPGVLEKFNKYEVDGLNIFIDKEAVLTGDTIEIELPEQDLGLSDKHFDVHGLKI